MRTIFWDVANRRICPDCSLGERSQGALTAERAGGCGSGVVTPHFDGVVVPLYSVARDGLRASVGLAPICAPPGPVSLYEAKPEAWAESFNFISAYWRRESMRLRLPPLTFMS